MTTIRTPAVPVTERLRRRLLNPYYFLLFRIEALTWAWRERKGRHDPVRSLPVPPPLLRFRVHGSFDRDQYLHIGEVCGRNIKDMLEGVGRDLYSFSAVLDFGCGSGRVLRSFQDRPDSCRLYGTDIDGQAISWCRENLDFATWSTNPPLPPTEYADDSFDFIYAISVFTHLDEQMQFAWLNELKRISKPGGVLLLSVHGASHAEEANAQLSEEGFLFIVTQGGRLRRDGLPAFYQTTFHSRAYIEEQWSRLFTIIGYRERGIGGVQDAVILLNP
jgi:SAM-dependent methyltransferase